MSFWLYGYRSYYCTKCNRIHATQSKIGRKHFKYNSKKQTKLDLGDIENEY